MTENMQKLKETTEELLVNEYLAIGTESKDDVEFLKVLLHKIKNIEEE